jgi:ATP-binding protein involved in chromosome partitioning
MATPQEILEDLKQIKFPGYTRDIVSFGIVRDIEIATGGITVTLAPVGRVRNRSMRSAPR